MTMSFLTRADVARVLNISHTACDTWYKQGFLPPPDADLGGQPLWREETIRSFDVDRERRRRDRRRPGILNQIERHLAAILDHARATDPRSAPIADAIGRQCADAGLTMAALRKAGEDVGMSFEAMRVRLYKMAASWAMDEMEKRASNGGAEGK